MKDESKTHLSKTPKETGFTVPEGYFETFERKMEERLADLPALPAETESIPLWHRMRPYLYMAAMFAGIMLMLRIVNDFRKPDATAKTTEAAVEAENDDALLEYIYYTSVSDHYLLYECLTQDDTETELP